MGQKRQPTRLTLARGAPGPLVHLLAGSIALWSVAMLASAFAPSFSVLVLTRVALGAGHRNRRADAGLAHVRLFPAGERAKVWGMILTGELLGQASAWASAGIS